MAHDTFIVTGGSTGIGAAICAELLARGHGVVNLSRRPLALEHDRLVNIELDLSERQQVAEAAQQIAGNSRSPALCTTLLICPDLLKDVSLDDFDYLSQVHIGAAISLTQAVIPGMQARALAVSC